jgi:hypothetical protein
MDLGDILLSVAEVDSSSCSVLVALLAQHDNSFLSLVKAQQLIPGKALLH